MATVNVAVKVDVPDSVTNSGKRATLQWLKEYFYELAGSNDGSEFLANLPINDKTVEITMENN